MKIRNLLLLTFLLLLVSCAHMQEENSRLILNLRDFEIPVMLNGEMDDLNFYLDSEFESGSSLTITSFYNSKNNRTRVQSTFGAINLPVNSQIRGTADQDRTVAIFIPEIGYHTKEKNMVMAMTKNLMVNVSVLYGEENE
ncbi:MAG: hypothetical protein PF447_15225 [Spirochaetaceae bacterium]|nr:hypothetical protein [Spirochaetaceae bacterium]